MKTIKEFAAHSQNAIPATLIRAVVKQMGGWEEFTMHAQDVTNHGADSGFNGFIYYTDTVAFTKRNKADILSYAKEQASDMGISSSFELIASFQCVDLSAEEVAEAIYNGKSDNQTEVYNTLAWYALEEVSRAYCDIQEEAAQ